MALRKRKAADLEPEPTTTTTKTGKVINSTAAASRPKRASTSAAEEPSAKKRKVSTSARDQKPPSRAPVKAAGKSVARKVSKPAKAIASRSSKAVKSAAVPRRTVKKAAQPAARLTKATKTKATETKPTKTKATATKARKTSRAKPSTSGQVRRGIPTLPRVDSTSFINITNGCVDMEDDDEDADDNVNAGEETDERSYWLMKAEPETRIETTASGKRVDVKFSIDDLRANPDPEPWEGIRNALAQKNLKAMKVGDQAFFYESNCKVPGIVGTMEIVQEASPDQAAFSKDSPYYDAKSKPSSPRWQLVHVAFRRKFKKIPLKELQKFGKVGGVLAGMDLIRQSRLSVGKVTPAEWNFIQTLVDGEDGEELAIRDAPVNVVSPMDLKPGDAFFEAEIIEQATREGSFEEPMLTVHETIEATLTVDDVTNQSVASIDVHRARPEVISPSPKPGTPSFEDASENSGVAEVVASVIMSDPVHEWVDELGAASEPGEGQKINADDMVGDGILPEAGIKDVAPDVVITESAVFANEPELPDMAVIPESLSGAPDTLMDDATEHFHSAVVEPAAL